MPDFVTESTATEQGLARRRGSGPVRILLFAIMGALLIGLAGFTASVALTPDKPVVQTMCLDSNCTFAMSADNSMSMPVSTDRQLRPASPKHRSAPERLVNEVLHICHLR